jgi:hypothetical protein
MGVWRRKRRRRRPTATKSPDLRPRPSRGDPRYARPIGVSFALGSGLDEMISHQVQDRHRHRPSVGCRKQRISFNASEVLEPSGGAAAKRVKRAATAKGSRNLLAIVFRHILISETLTPFQPFFGQ